MSKTFEQGRAEIAQLCSYFKTNQLSFVAEGVKEAHIRQNLIDPFFAALGWDVHNVEMSAPQNREVIPEDSLDVDDHRRAPDYTFRVGRSAMFYVEAKKCDASIKDDSAHAYQLRRYGWSAKVAVSILTNFEELAIYDCTSRPNPNDKASHARILYFRFDEYVDRWKEIWNIFSREAVWSGAFDQYAASKRKRGTSEVDDEFLKELEGWRESLARNLAIRNPDLSADDLNSAVQLTIDRVVFLRMAEDRGIEPYDQLLTLCEQPNIYNRFVSKLCQKADEKYNSGLFHFQKEEGVSEAPDRITPKLNIEDNVFKPILQSLYFAHGSPYHFGVLPVEILGTVYERFLGKVIRLTAGHQAKVEEKPEVRKAGGVYYTPSYIVDYIVENTLGEYVSGRSPAQIAGRNGDSGKPALRVLDMACGSGSFLLGAYQFLLEYCLKWYCEHKPENHKKAVYQDRKGQWRLTVDEKKRILTTHVFGVDIDAQAVEVSKLSLLLKVLEGETSESLTFGMLNFNDRALPNLSNNIKCGNSLIGPDYFAGMLIPDEDEIKRVNPFDWNKAFPEIMEAGGFDCIVGNPPYVRIQGFPPRQVRFLTQQYECATGNYDVCVNFVEKGFRLAKKHANLSWILPNKFFKTEYGNGLRRFLSGKKAVSQIVSFGAEQVFGATTYTCLLFLRKKSNPTFRYGESKADHESLQATRFTKNDSSSLTQAAWTFSNSQSLALTEKLKNRSQRLLDFPVSMSRGSSSGDDQVFVIDTKEISVEAGILRQPLFASDFGRYKLNPSKKWKIIFPYIWEGTVFRLFTETELKNKFPKAYAYLLSKKAVLKKRKQFRMWYGYSAPRNLKLHERAQLMVPLLANRGIFALFPKKSASSFCPMASAGFTIALEPSCSFNEKYLLGLVNSRLLFWCLSKASNVFRGGWITCTKQYFGELPIRIIDFKNKKDQTRHDAMVALVDTMLLLHEQLSAANSAQAKELLQHQINSTEAEIDQLVYELYELTPEEIEQVESATHPAIHP